MYHDNVEFPYMDVIFEGVTGRIWLALDLGADVYGGRTSLVWLRDVLTCTAAVSTADATIKKDIPQACYVAGDPSDPRVRMT